MKANIHIETPDGEVVKHIPETGSGNAARTPEEKKDEAMAIAAGPKVNPDERANANLTEEEKQNNAKQQGAGTEITDGEGG